MTRTLEIVLERKETRRGRYTVFKYRASYGDTVGNWKTDPAKAVHSLTCMGGGLMEIYYADVREARRTTDPPSTT